MFCVEYFFSELWGNKVIKYLIPLLSSISRAFVGRSIHHRSLAPPGIWARVGHYGQILAALKRRRFRFFFFTTRLHFILLNGAIQKKKKQKKKKKKEEEEFRGEGGEGAEFTTTAERACVTHHTTYTRPLLFWKTLMGLRESLAQNGPANCIQ